MPSPCTKVCTLDADRRLCVGCGRTLDEIGAWSGASPERQREIVESAATRLADRSHKDHG